MTCSLIKFIHFLRYNAIACLDYSTVCMLSCFSHCPTLWEPMACSPPGSSVHGNSPGKNTGVGSHFLLQGIFPTQISYISCIGRQILYQYSVNIAFICTGKPKKKKKKIVWLALLQYSLYYNGLQPNSQYSRCLPVYSSGADGEQVLL